MSIVERSMQRIKGPTGEPVPLEQVLLAEPERDSRSPVKIDFNFSAAEESGFDFSASRSGHLYTQMRALKRKVMDAVASRADPQAAPVVLVTSSVPGDGKSFIALHLAIAFASELDLEVTLVDADIARQRVSSLFARREEPGLCECLLNRTPVAAAVCDTQVQSLSVLLAGQMSDHAPDALASDRWDDVANQMRRSGRGHFFIVDSAPVLATPEAGYLSKSADLVLFVVRAEVTPTDAVSEALVRLGDTSRVAFVFNGRSHFGNQYLYSYGEYGKAK